MGIVGYGYWGPNLARNRRGGSEGDLAAIADFSKRLSRAPTSVTPPRNCFTDWRALIADPAIDAVVIATPVASHFEMALAALKAGKHVLSRSQ